MAIELAVALLGFYVFNVTTVGKPEIPGILGVLLSGSSLFVCCCLSWRA